MHLPSIFSFFFFNDTATTEIYTLSLHDALPIYNLAVSDGQVGEWLYYAEYLRQRGFAPKLMLVELKRNRSEEHTSELQSRLHLVCRLLLEKKKTNIKHTHNPLKSHIALRQTHP